MNEVRIELCGMAVSSAPSMSGMCGAMAAS